MFSRSASAQRAVRRAPCQPARGHSFKVSFLSRLAARAAIRLTARKTVSRPPPRRVAATRNLPEPSAARRPQLQEAHAAGRLATLSVDAKRAAAAGPESLYRHMVAAGSLKPDLAQERALPELMRVFEDLRASRRQEKSGLYLHGDVGGGKTLLMDVFLASMHAGLPRVRTLRTHLHEFMNSVHSELHRARLLNGDNGKGIDHANSHASATSMGAASLQAPSVDTGSFFKVLPDRWWLLGDMSDQGRRRTGYAAAWVDMARHGGAPTSVELLGRALAKELRVLCFDEMAIATIQDCVVLGPLLSAICRGGVVVLITSNRAPNELYAGGLNRHIHLPPVVDAISRHCQLHRLDSVLDHRERMANAEEVGAFLWSCSPGSPHGAAFIENGWLREAGTAGVVASSLRMSFGRELPAVRSPCGKCARLQFSELCGQPLGVDDFARLCMGLRVLFVRDVPRMQGEQHAEAQRWIWLIDQCYEQHTRLIMTSEAESPDDLVDLDSVAHAGEGGGRSLREVAFAVARTRSRLQEMQTEAFVRACAERRA